MHKDSVNHILEHLKAHLKGKVVILGIGNNLRCDDGFGSLLASRLKDKVPYIVYDAATSPENYLGKIVKDSPENIVIIDSADFGGYPGELRLAQTDEIQSVNLFSTHNASLSLTTNYLKKDLRADIIILIIQPKCIAFGDKLSPEISDTLEKLEHWFYETAQEKG